MDDQHQEYSSVHLTSSSFCSKTILFGFYFFIVYLFCSGSYIELSFAPTGSKYKTLCCMHAVVHQRLIHRPMDSAYHHNHIISVPRLRAFEWPPRGCLQYMGNWTLEKGIATLEARVAMQDRRPESPPLSPMSKPAHAQDQLGSLSSTASGTPSCRTSETPLVAYSYYSEAGTH